MPRIKKFNKTDVVKDAMVLFWEKGFHQTSVQELVQEIGINRASLYDTYHDKEGLFKESFNFYRHSVKENIQSIFNQHKTIKAGYNDFIKYLIIELLADKYGCLISNSYSELLPSENKDFQKLTEETRLMWRKLIMSILTQAKEQDELIDPNINIEYVSDSLYMNIVGTAMLSKTKIDTKKLHYNLELIGNKILFK